MWRLQYVIFLFIKHENIDVSAFSVGYPILKFYVTFITFCSTNDGTPNAALDLNKDDYLLIEIHKFINASEIEETIQKGNFSFF